MGLDPGGRYVLPACDGDAIRFVGSVGPEERNALLGKARALLHPISFDEPFGLSVAEAMACGTPTVAFNRGSMPELIEHGANGLLVSTVNDAIEAVGRIGSIDRANCRNTAYQRFSSSRMASDYIHIYEQILAHKK